MEIALIFGRLALAAVFAVAGLTKLRDLAGARVALIEFGVPKSVAGPGGLLLPLVELAVAICLLPAATAAWAALAALALLVLFTAAIAFNLARGRRPACRCFGRLSAEPVGRSTLIRNGLLTLLAAVVAWQSWSRPPSSLLSWLGQLGAAEAVLLSAIVSVVVAVAVLFWLLLQVIHQQGRLLLRIDEPEQRLVGLDGHAAHHADAPPESEGLPLDTPAPDFALASLTCERRTLADLLQPDRPLLLVFTDPNCGSCTALLPEIAGWQRALERRVDIAVIGRSTVEANRAHATEYGVSPFLLQLNDEVADAYRVFGTPGAVLIRPGGAIGSPVAGGPEAIGSLVMHTATNPAGPAWSPLLLQPMAEAPGHSQDHPEDHGAERPLALPVGAPAPEFELPDLDGRPVRLVELRGRPILILFLSPGCAPCHRLLPVMLAWEANLANLSNLPDRSVQLLVISEGTVDSNRVLGFRATVAIDETLTISEQFGVSGTPAAILISDEGAIASDLAIGGPDILVLANVALESSGQANPSATTSATPFVGGSTPRA